MEKKIYFQINREKRVLFIDIAKGIGIILMIIGHSLKLGSLKRNTIFSFHMPLFIITSGFFYKRKTFMNELKNLIINLLIPTMNIYFFVFLYSNIDKMAFKDFFKNIIKSIIIGYSHQSKIKYEFKSIGVLWFNYFLIILRLLFNINKKIEKENDIILFIIILMETYIGYLIGVKKYWLPWSIDVSFACILFYYVGYILNKYKIFYEIYGNIKIILIIFLMWIEGIKYNWIEIAVRKYPNGLWCYITAISGSIIILILAWIIEAKLKIFSKFLSLCGKNSLYILFGHHIEMSLINYKLLIVDKSTYYEIIILLKCLFSISFAFVLVNLKNLRTFLLNKIKNKITKRESKLIHISFLDKSK